MKTHYGNEHGPSLCGMESPEYSTRNIKNVDCLRCLKKIVEEGDKVRAPKDYSLQAFALVCVFVAVVVMWITI